MTNQEYLALTDEEKQNYWEKEKKHTQAQIEALRKNKTACYAAQIINQLDDQVYLLHHIQTGAKEILDHKGGISDDEFAMLALALENVTENMLQILTDPEHENEMNVIGLLAKDE